jgi:hypothetical protein
MESFALWKIAQNFFMHYGPQEARLNILAIVQGKLVVYYVATTEDLFLLYGALQGI